MDAYVGSDNQACRCICVAKDLIERCPDGGNVAYPWNARRQNSVNDRITGFEGAPWQQRKVGFEIVD